MSSNPKTRKALFEEQKGRCHYCPQQMTLKQGLNHSITADHLIPKSQGGTHSRSNLVGACWQCNALRGDRPYRYFKSHRDHLALVKGLPCQKRAKAARIGLGLRVKLKEQLNALPAARSRKLPKAAGGVVPISGAMIDMVAAKGDRP